MDRVAETFPWGTRNGSKTNYSVASKELVKVKRLDAGIPSPPAP
jgi:hypothetical protein